MYALSKAAKWAIFRLSKVGSLLRISRAMLKVEHSFELRNLYNLRFIESEIWLPLFEYETTKSGLQFIYSHHFWVFCLLSTKSWVEHQSMLEISLSSRAQVPLALCSVSSASQTILSHTRWVQFLQLVKRKCSFAKFVLPVEYKKHRLRPTNV